MASREKVIEKLEKIKKLAENGVGGEKDGAEKLLKKLMSQYNISENELIEDKKECAWFRYKDFIEKRFVVQVIDAIVGECDYYHRKDKRKVVGVYCTKLEEIEISTTFDF